MISSLLKLVMRDCELSQRELAEVLGSPLDRVKSLTSGRVKNLTRQESEALIAKLNIRADWLVTGTGPMLQGEETQDAFVARLQSGSRHIDLVKALPLAKLDQDRLAVLMTGDPVHDAALIAASLQYQFHGGRQHRVESAVPTTVGAAASELARSEDRPSAIGHSVAETDPPLYFSESTAKTNRQKALLANFEAASEQGRQLIEGVAELAAKSR